MNLLSVESGSRDIWAINGQTGLGLIITLEDNGDTLLTGQVADQAALHGLLRKVRDLGQPLVSVIHAEPEQTDMPDVKP
jgi:hypothetical protein